MPETKLYDDVVRGRLEAWGNEFNLLDKYGHRLGAGKHILQRLIEHRGELPPPNVGFKPLTISLEALEVEDIVESLFREHPEAAIVLRAAYASWGSTENRVRIAAKLIGHGITRRQYYALRDIAFHRVAGALMRRARSA